MQTGSAYIQSIAELTRIDRGAQCFDDKLKHALEIVNETVAALATLLVTQSDMKLSKVLWVGEDLDSGRKKSVECCLAEELSSLLQITEEESSLVSLLAKVCAQKVSVFHSSVFIASYITKNDQPVGLVMAFRSADERFSKNDERFLTIASDILSQLFEKHAEEKQGSSDIKKIAAAKRQWENSVDVMPQLVLLLDENGKVIRSNRTIESWFKISVREVQGKSIHELFHPQCMDEQCALFSNMQKILLVNRNNNYSSVELFDEKNDNWFLFESYPFQPGRKTESEQWEAGITLVVHDVTLEKHRSEVIQTISQELKEKQQIGTKQRKAVESGIDRSINARGLRKIWESESQYATLLNTTVIGIYVAEENRIRFCNRRFADMLGYEVKSLIGLNLNSLILNAPEKQEVDLNNLQKELPNTQIVRGMKRNGNSMWFIQSTEEIWYQDRQVILGNVLDITEQIRIQQELEQSKTELECLSKKLISVQELERRRIASDLHDGIGQILAGIKMSIEASIKETSEQREEQNVPLMSIIDKVQSSMDEVRRIAMGLRPATLDSLGIVATFRWFCREFQQDIPEMKIAMHIGVDEHQVPDALKTDLFRILQEAMHNISKHAKACSTEIRLEIMGQELGLKIADNGKGFSEIRVHKDGGGMGLVSIRERVERWGGTFQIESKPGAGTTLECIWPLNDGNRQVDISI